MNITNQAFRIKIAYWSKKEKKEKEKKEKEEKIPGIGRYPMGPTINMLSYVFQGVQLSVEISGFASFNTNPSMTDFCCI